MANKDRPINPHFEPSQPLLFASHWHWVEDCYEPVHRSGFQGLEKGYYYRLVRNVDGSVKRPVNSTSLGKSWDRVNDVVIGWLLNAMDEKVAGSVLYFKTAKEYGMSWSINLVSLLVLNFFL